MEENNVTLHRMVRLSDLKPNPFRDMETFPIVEEKVEALVGSMTKDGYWNNIEARPARDGNGYEIAYGHHRVEALRRMYGEDAVVAVMVDEFDNGAMVRRMANENLTDWSNASAERESIRAVVLAFAAGEVDLPAPEPKTPENNIRVAPSFKRAEKHVPENLPAHASKSRPKTKVEKVFDPKAYSAASIAAYLGGSWENSEAAKVRDALGQLETLETGLVREEDVRDLPKHEAVEVMEAARRVERRAKLSPTLAPHATTIAAKVSSDLAEKMRTNETSYRGKVRVSEKDDKGKVLSSRIETVPTYDEVIEGAYRKATDEVAPGIWGEPESEPVLIPAELVRGVANAIAKVGMDIKRLNDLMSAHPEAAPFVRGCKGGVGQPEYLKSVLVGFDSKYQTLVSVIVNGADPVPAPLPITSGVAPASARVVSE